MKRFYKAVTSSPVAGGHEIHLDGKPIKTPSGKKLLAPNETLAGMIAAEWAGQGADIIPDTMPLTQILTTALDRVPQNRAEMEKSVCAYIDTDLLCYRAAHPPGMVERQAALWDPWLDWFEGNYGVHLRTSDHLRALRQVPEAHKLTEDSVAAFDDMKFTIFQVVVAASGSLVLGLAFMAGKIDADAAFAAIHAEEGYKAEIYRADIHGFAPHEEKLRAALLKDLVAAQDFLRAL